MLVKIYNNQLPADYSKLLSNDPEDGFESGPFESREFVSPNNRRLLANRKN